MVTSGRVRPLRSFWGADTQAAKGAKFKLATKKDVQAGKKATRGAKANPPCPEGKGAKILGLIGCPQGASLAEIQKATAWQAHSVRGYLSTAAKKHHLKIESMKTEAGDRVYQVKK